MPQAPTWKVVLAFVLDFFITFFVFGYVVAYLTGNTTPNGFSIEGIPALVAFALIVAYFVLMNRVLHWTIGKKIMRIA
jgi:uncharacterized RDD family membrane protein YckC